jgi:hypothetical protein
MSLTKRQRLAHLRRERNNVDLSAYSAEEKSKMRQLAQNLARNEVIKAHHDEYTEAYQGWLEAVKEQREREGSI